MSIKMQENNDRFIILKITLCAFFWGGTYIAGKVAAPYVTPAVLGFSRFLIASLCLCALLFKQNDFKMISRKQFFDFIILSFFGIVTYNILVQIGLADISAIRSSLIVIATPLVVAVGSVIFFKDKLIGIQILGLLITIFGSALLITNGDFSSFLTSFSIGDLAIFGAMFSWAFYILASRKMLNSLSPLLTITWICIISTVLFFPIAVYELFMYENIFSLEFYLSATYLGTFSTVLAYIWFYQSVNAIGTTRTTVFMNLEPLSAVLIGTTFLGESFTFFMAIGGLLSLFGVYITNNPTFYKKSS